MDQKTSIWEHFERVDSVYAKCKECNVKLKSVGGSTSGLHNHLKNIHKTGLKRKEIINDKVTKPLPKINKYFHPRSDDTMHACISRMVAKDGLAFRMLCSSNDLRMLLVNKFKEQVPSSPNTIRKIVMEYCDQIQKQVKQSIKTMKSNGKRFSITFDEWTSLQNRRYLNLNIHFVNESIGFYNLGLVRVRGSMPAESCVSKISEKLSDFGLSFKDIVCITTDGASVMQKVGRLVPSHQLLCMLHGIQLAVIDVLYAKPSEIEHIVVENNSDNDDSNDEVFEDNDNEFGDVNVSLQV